MRILRSLVLLAVAGAAFSGLPSQAAAPKQAKAVIHLPLAGLSSALGAGVTEGEDVSPLRQTCPGPSALDGVTFKFFELKGDYKKFVATGPKPVVSQQAPVVNSTYSEYDIDIYVFDAKCKRVMPNSASSQTGTTSGPVEKLSVTKPARYAVVSYYSGPYVDLPVTLEYS